MDATPVEVRGDELSEVWWQGRQWAVTAYGVECRDGTYAIEAKRLWERDLNGGPDWPRHMAEKNWLDVADFCTAFLVALALHPRPKGEKGFTAAELRMALDLALAEAGDDPD